MAWNMFKNPFHNPLIMGWKGVIYGFLVVATAIVALRIFIYCTLEPPLPELRDLWWGRGPYTNFKTDISINKFTINVEDKVLQDLKQKLKATIYPEPLENAQFEYGFNTDYLKQVVDYWINKYDWKKQEARINSFPHFKTYINGIDVHFMHIKPQNVPKDVKVLPLIMIHGWPGSFVEFLDIIPMLTTPVKGREFVFELVIPSIPGYGFSEAPHQRGFGPLQAAFVFDKLMQRLNYNRYYTQGGDWGSLIATHMATLYFPRVKGIHANLVFNSNSPKYWFQWILGTYFPSLIVSEKDYPKLYPMGEKVIHILRESGYMHIQATKPDTVGIGLANSPAALAAYILEKFSTWTDKSGIDYPDGQLTKKFTLDQLLTNVMVYYVTGTITSSARFYKENFNEAQQAHKMDQISCKAPAGLAMFPHELLRVPENMAKWKFPQLLSYTDMPRGGHFAAFEEPKLVADDVWQFVNKSEQYWTELYKKMQ